jgi:hypothetical protein
MRRLTTITLLASLSVSAMASGKGLSNVIITQAGPTKVIYDWSKDRCEDEFIPDAPARAFRRADGQLALIATHRENWVMLGENFDELRPSCQSILRTSKQHANGIGMLWIEATFTHDGRNIAALVSNDMTRLMKDRGCDQRGTSTRCWLNSIVFAHSEDMGESFTFENSESSTVASLGSDYPKEQQERVGVFTTSNIVRQGDWYYSIFFAQSARRQQAGNCLFRTDDPFKHQNWRGWDGSQFTVNMSNPEAKGSCETIPSSSIPDAVRSLSFDTQNNVWIAIYRSRLRTPGDKQAVPGFYYSLSDNLTQWSSPKRIMTAPTRPREDDQHLVMSFPSLIDPLSKSRNFDSVDSANPILLFTVHHLKNGNGTMNRDLVYVPLKIQAQ